MSDIANFSKSAHRSAEYPEPSGEFSLTNAYYGILVLYNPTTDAVITVDIGFTSSAAVVTAA